MGKKQGVVADGTVVETLPNSQCRVELDSPEGHIALCHVSGKMRMH
ncbi:MAG: translation initiation factor IF-1, partial [Candidatus Aegiribacteria sp.]|nr:translation initiation factor IF-1 [Candidatus Aegiribacteria sp.]